LRLFGKPLFIVCALIASLLSVPIRMAAQTPEDVLRMRTRVVFLDALVKEKRSGMPIADLQLENFQVLDDGKERAISYFTREGQARNALALVITDCREDGAGRFLKRPEILKSMADELAKLPKEDEVALMAMNIGEARNVSGFRLHARPGAIDGGAGTRAGLVENPDQVLTIAR
jgi:hypothetical protein